MHMHHADGLHEPGHAHDDSEMPLAEGGDSELVVNVAELRRGGEDAEVKQADVGGWAARRTLGSGRHVVLPRLRLLVDS